MKYLSIAVFVALVLPVATVAAHGPGVERGDNVAKIPCTTGKCRKEGR